MIAAPIGVTKPAPGVMATSPTTAPVTMPRTLGLSSIQLKSIHTRAAAAAEVLVVKIARAAMIQR